MTRFICIFALMILALPAFGHSPSGVEGDYNLSTEIMIPSNATFSHDWIPSSQGGVSTSFTFSGDCQTLIRAKKVWPGCSSDRTDDCNLGKAQDAIKADIANAYPGSVFPWNNTSNTSNPTTSQIQTVNNRYIQTYQDCADSTIHYHYRINQAVVQAVVVERHNLQLVWTWQFIDSKYQVYTRTIVTDGGGDTLDEDLSIRRTISPNSGAYWTNDGQSSTDNNSNNYIIFTTPGTYTVSAETTYDGQTLTAEETIVYPRPDGDWGNDDRLRESAESRSASEDTEPEPTTKSTTPTEPTYANEDVNRDGVIDNDDLTAIANNLGAAPKGDIQGYDVDGDGDIDTNDFQQVLNSVEANAAPAARSLTEPETILEHIKQLPQIAPPPRVTALLPNYPNPFNPETWIPYHLAHDAEVILTIYAVDGQVVRELDLGHRTAGNYQHRAKAAYWDGRDALGFPVSSGVYFYSLSAGNFSATRKMLIAK